MTLASSISTPGAATFDDFTRCGNMKEAMRAHLNERVKRLGYGGIARVAREMGDFPENVSQVLRGISERGLGWAMADRMIAALDRIDQGKEEHHALDRRLRSVA